MIANYWNNLNERERWVLGIGLFVLFFYFFYLLVYSPLSTAVNNKTNQLAEKKELLAWMEQMKHKPKSDKKTQSITNPKLLGLIGHQLTHDALKSFKYQLQQTGASDIQLSFEKVPYNLFLSWLWSLSKNYSINLKQFNVERSDPPGIVKLVVVISAKS